MKYFAILLLLFAISTENAFCENMKNVANFFVRELNKELSITPEKKPIVLITVTRKGDNKTPKILREELTFLLKALNLLSLGKKLVTTGAKTELPIYTTLPSNPAFSSNLTPRQIADLNSITEVKRSSQIIIFNEMFFSQVVPLQDGEKDDVVNAITGLSARSNRTILYPNILYIKPNVPMDNAALNAVVNESYANIGNKKMNISPRHRGALVTKIANAIKTPYIGGPHNIDQLINESMAIHNGLILTRYRKSTYFQESDATLAHNANCWYIFGTSQDIIEPGQARNRLAVFLRKRISSEICFDLALGIRKNNPSSTSQIHIIQSNYIDATMYENQNNLQNSKLMIHVDPETILRNQTIHKYNNILSKFK